MDSERNGGDSIFTTVGETGENVKDSSELGSEAVNAYDAEISAEKARMSAEFKKMMTKAVVTTVIVGALVSGAAGFFDTKLANKLEDKKDSTDNEPKIESEYTGSISESLRLDGVTIETADTAAEIEEVAATSGNWAGETSNGIKYDYELAGFINEDGAILYEWHNEDGDDFYDYGLPIMEDWTQDEWKESFDNQLQGNPTIIGRVASNVLTEDELASVINDYNNKDENKDNDISLDYGKTDDMHDIAHQLEFAMKDAAEGDAAELQNALIDAILKEEVTDFEHIDEENVDAETSVLLSAGKDPTFADIHEQMVEHHYDKLNGVKVTYANGNVVTYGKCGSAQVVVLPPEPEPKTPTTNVKTGSEKTGSEKTGNEKTGNEKTGSEKTGSEKTGNEKTSSEKTGSETTIEPKGPDTHAGDDVAPAPTTPIKDNTDYQEATPDNHVEPEPGSSSEANPDSGRRENTNYSNDELEDMFANDF